jgi:hypothetical protein
MLVPMSAQGDPALADELMTERARLEPVAAEVPALERELDELLRRVAAIEGSFWWRITAPLRIARRVVNGRRALALRLGRHIRDRLLRG